MNWNMQKNIENGKNYVSNLDSPLGVISIESSGEAILSVGFGAKEATKEQCSLNFLAQEQLREYFEGKRREFTLPLAPKGTPFYQKVWQALLQIPYGETRSYGQIAAQLGSPKASRAVGMANHNNPIAILIPCHRVIGADGRLVGYASGLGVKEALLKLEQETVDFTNRFH